MPFMTVIKKLNSAWFKIIFTEIISKHNIMLKLTNT